MNEPTPKDRRVSELKAKIKTGNLPTMLKDYHHYLDTLLYLNEALVNEKDERKLWNKFSNTLLLKFAFHGFTLHHIWSGLSLSSDYYPKQVNGVRYTDVPSARAVLRAQLETFLMHHYIYVNPTEDGTNELRYYSWIYSGLLQRQDFPARSEFAQQQRQKSEKEIEQLKNIIVNLPAYQALSPKQQVSLIKTGSAKLFKHWDAIFAETGFAKNNSFVHLYTMLCVYSHSEGLSAMQLNDSLEDPSFQIFQSMADCLNAMELTCIMITSLTKMWPAAKERFLDMPQQLQWDIELMAMFGKSTSDKPAEQL